MDIKERFLTKEDLEKLIQDAENGDPAAQLELGIQYLEGIYSDEDFLLEKDKEKAFAWVLKSAENGNAIAQNRIGTWYSHGMGCEKDYNNAAYWLEESAKNGNDQAQFTIGTYYLHGRGVTKNTNTAIDWFQKSANQGNIAAKQQLQSLGVRGYESYDIDDDVDFNNQARFEFSHVKK